MIKLVSEYDPILKKSTELVTEEDFSFIKEIYPQMIDIMLKNNGIGLAAPQIGISKKFFIVKNNDNNFKIIINPKYTLDLTISQPIVDQEGCLSYPGLWLKVGRYSMINATYVNIDNQEVKETLYGIQARVFQHEYDHLNGICYTSYVGKTSLMMAQDKRKKFINRSKK